MGRKSGKDGKKTVRRVRFEEELRARGGKNAPDAALAAGYSESYARARADELAVDVRIEIASALRAHGFTGDTLARNIVDLTKARLPKWNHKKEKWDVFADSGTRLAANMAGAKLLGFAEPKEAGDTRPVQVIFPGSFANLAVKVETHGEERSR